MLRRPRTVAKLMSAFQNRRGTHSAASIRCESCGVDLFGWKLYAQRIGAWNNDELSTNESVTLTAPDRHCDAGSCPTGMLVTAGCHFLWRPDEPSLTSRLCRLGSTLSGQISMVRSPQALSPRFRLNNTRCNFSEEAGLGIIFIRQQRSISAAGCASR